MYFAGNILPVIRETRGKLLHHWGKIKENGRKDHRAISSVTQLDLDIERYLKAKLANRYPYIGFVGEECGGDRNAERFWLCDPIDGTGHFVRGLPFCTVMLALIECDEVKFGVVYDFVNDIAYHATRGEGAFANGSPIHVSQGPLSHGYVAYESHMEKSENRAFYTRLYAKASLMETLSAGWEFAMVAAGKLEARVSFDGWGSDYDYAPGSLLVQEAGGIVANIGKSTYDYRNPNFIAAGPLVFKELTEGPDAVFPIN